MPEYAVTLNVYFRSDSDSYAIDSKLLEILESIRNLPQVEDADVESEVDWIKD